MTDRARGLAMLTVAVVILSILTIVTLPGPTLFEDGPDGTIALQRVAADVGFDVSTGDDPPASGTFVLARDIRQQDDAEAVLRWAAAGNRLVLASPNSLMIELLEVEVAGRASGGFSGTDTLARDCDLPELRGVERIRVRVGDRRYELPSGARGCFVERDAAFLVVLDHGDGTVVLLGGETPLVNAHLRDADNALFALHVLGTDRDVRFGSIAPPPPGGGLWETLPNAARAILLGLLFGVVLLVAWSWRRLGRPVAESSVTTIGAGRLVDAVAGLYRESGDRTHVARRLQEHTLDRARRRNGLPPNAGPAEVATVLAAISTRERHDIERLLTRSPDDPGDLLVLARDLHDLHEELENR